MSEDRIKPMATMVPYPGVPDFTQPWNPLDPGPLFPGHWPPAQVSGFVPTVYTLPPRFSVPNKRVAVEPFPETAKDRNRVRGGVLEPMGDAALIKLKVVFGSDDYLEGQYVYVRANLATKTTYGKEVFEAEGRKFTLIPETDIVLVERYSDTGSVQTATITGSK